ncbi:MAG TPA: Rv3654c family TadE-like protein [Nocardioidaceae bacterium]|nr:Rv3654c family TadE-like protein [Nocardioidaceae bacterium]
MTRRRRHLDERASAAVLGTVVIGLLVTLTLVGGTIAALLVGQRRAASGADLAALAGASALQQGRSGCAEASTLAEANRVRVVRCAVSGDVVTVDVSTEVASALGSAWTLRARARAGPVE